MKPLNLVNTRGDTWTYTFSFTDEADRDGFVWRSQIRDRDDELVGEFVTSYEAPTVTLTLSDTSAAPVGVHRWDLQYTNGGEKRTLVGGTFTVIEDVTE